MAKPVVIGSLSFRTQKSALDHYKALLHRYQDGDRISDPGDHAHLVALVERYDPILDQVGEPAKGCGQIGHFERRLNTGTGWSNSGFWVVRLDGSATDFSYIWAVKGLPGDGRRISTAHAERLSHSISFWPRSVPSRSMATLMGWLHAN